MSAPISQLISAHPPHPTPPRFPPLVSIRLFSTSVSLFLPCKPVHLYHFSYKFIYLWLCWVFVSVWGLSLVAASGGHSSSRCTGLSLSRPLLWSTGSRCAGSAAVAHGPSCSAACGILPGQGSNPCPLHRQADSQPLRHQGSPLCSFLYLQHISMQTCNISIATCGWWLMC